VLRPAFAVTLCYAVLLLSLPAPCILIGLFVKGIKFNKKHKKVETLERFGKRELQSLIGSVLIMD